MSNTRSFSDFDSPDSGTVVGGAKEAGVLLTDTLEDLREKTNGIVEKVKAIDTEATAIKAGGLDTNSVALDKIVQTSARKLLGNALATGANVTEIPMATTSGAEDGSSGIYGIQASEETSGRTIPTSKAVKDYVDYNVSSKLDSSTFTAFKATSATTHYIDAYTTGMTTTANSYSLTTAQIEFIATAMTGVVAVGHFVLARVAQYYGYWGGNGTSYANRQMFIMLKVTALDGSEKPTLEEKSSGFV